ncbi:hypothetical protein BMD20_29585 [Burkholderia multivorans]|nr:hypothetical protein BMD20_29585 [Burkholderia multivorans]KHS10378.1 hypothetical protein BMD22_28240 [Burkholderia multivorans]MDR9230044.1 hypothetical protein [Burkholderia multivorans]
MKFFIATFFCVLPSITFSATYAVNEMGGMTSGVSLKSAGVTGCVYAGQHIALGDILSYPDGTRQVCASSDRGPQLMDLATDAR